MSAVAPAEGHGASAKPLAITGVLVLVVMSMVIPIPAALLDAGIALSIATSVLILVMASVVHKPTDFQAFPVMLLLSLVIRLSLNVSSTRLILTEGHTGAHAAGEVINGFAQFVAGGSLMVGITVFAVISIVNFMVITKGSGRMAEVSARFALDSLPGKQLAIDGDLNSGAITHDEAKRRRAQDGREISFYGSLDGASKFVKGDAIAAIIITLVNLIADTLRLVVVSSGTLDVHAVEEVMDHSIKNHHHDVEGPQHTLTSLADSLPALGIVAAVLGIVKTMGSIDKPPSVLGGMIGSALVGTFMGVLLAYGVVNPLANRLQQVIDADAAIYDVVKQIIIASLHGHPQPLVIEAARAGIAHKNQPGFAEVFDGLRGK